MKKIQIEGNGNIKKLLPEQYDNTRKEIKNLNIPESLFEYRKQVEMINTLYLNTPLTEDKILKRFINHKLSSYKQQDIKNEIYGPNYFISFDETVQKLVESKLKCFYCNKDLYLIYKEIKDKDQWTLDRINNDMGHNTDNVIICCLDCNLQRKTRSSNKFLFTKKLNIIKK
jgi:5-methylcytosine-specific restriction endonuclease McrA